MNTVAKTHALERTNEKGVKGIFRCVQCGEEGLPAEAALKPCTNPNNTTEDQALLNAILDGPGPGYRLELPASDEPDTSLAHDIWVKDD